MQRTVQGASRFLYNSEAMVPRWIKQRGLPAWSAPGHQHAARLACLNRGAAASRWIDQELLLCLLLARAASASTAVGYGLKGTVHSPLSPRGPQKGAPDLHRLPG
jgi:hypothetical protein